MGSFKGDVGLAGRLFSEFVEVVSASDKWKVVVSVIS